MNNERQTLVAFRQLASTFQGVIESDSTARLLVGATSANLKCPFSKDRNCSRECGNFTQTSAINITVSLLTQEAVLGKNYSTENIAKALKQYVEELKASKAISEEKCNA